MVHIVKTPVPLAWCSDHEKLIEDCQGQNSNNLARGNRDSKEPTSATNVLSLFIYEAVTLNICTFP